MGKPEKLGLSLFRARHIYLVVFGQAICLATALWMQHRLLGSAARSAAEEQEVSRMAAVAAAISREFDSADLISMAQQPHAQLQLASMLQSDVCAITIVDADGRPVWTNSPMIHLADGGQEPPPVEWRVTGPSAGPGSDVGILTTLNGPHLGLSAALGSDRGRIILHLPQTQVDAAVGPFLGVATPISISTFLWTLVLLSITIYLISARYDESLQTERSRSNNDVLRQTHALLRTRDAVIFALAKLAEFRDYDTGNHLERIAAYSSVLAEELSRHPRYNREVTPTFLRFIGISSILHDIGKVGVEDQILRKPGKLTAHERLQMQLHTAIAANCLDEIARRLGNSNFLHMARDVALCHHEHWNGSGYPNKLSGDRIPLAARIVAIADVYDALASARPYKQALPHDKCVQIIREAAGIQLDPDLVQLWLGIQNKFRDIAVRMADQDCTNRQALLEATISGGPPPPSTDKTRVSAGTAEVLEPVQV